MKSQIQEHQENNFKMLTKSKIIFLLAVSIASISMYSQEVKEPVKEPIKEPKSEKKAEKQYDKFAYVDAIKTYERIAEKGYRSQEMLEKLGDSHYFKGDLPKAAKWYGELFALNQEVEPEYYYRYAQSLKSVEDYAKADEMMAKFSEKNAEDLRAKLAASQKDYLTQIKQHSGRYTVENAGINSQFSDYGSSFYQNKVIFTSARDTSGSRNGNKSSWTGEAFTNLYGADMSDDGVLSAPAKFGGKLNTKFHECSPVFTKDGKTVYFTRNNFNDGKKGKDARESMLLKIYKATLSGEKWGDIVELPFNSNDYSIAHPALSADEKTLYFVSNMPGTIGQSDLFKVAINGDGTFGTPTNLGNTINTEGRETFPMVTSDGELYFASDGRPGLGGLDIYKAKIENDGTFTNIKNLGEPVNSPQDDFGFVINDKTRIGYFTSNRDGGMGGDDIYKFKENACEQTMNGVVTDKDSGLPLAGVKVTLSDANYKLLQTVVTNAEGKFDFGKVDCEAKYFVKTEKEEYTTIETPVVVGSESGNTFVPITLGRAIVPVVVGDDLAKAFGIKIIYFDLDKSNIRKDAAVELSKILDVMNENPDMEIDIRSHTDSRQTFKYNEGLSNRRAKSTKAWLVGKGVKESRLTAKGYGETQLVNKCSDGVKCTEDEHQANRRSEFVITKL